MRLETDTMGQKERLETVLNHQEPDRLPFYLMGMPDYGDFFQEFLSREEELLDPWTEDDQNVVLTPCGDFTMKEIFGADIVVRGEQVDYPKSQWVDEQGNPTDQGQFVDNREVGMKVNYFGYFDKSEILPNGHVYTWYYGPHLKTENEFINWFDTYGWPHELPVKDSGSEISETNGRFNDVIHVIPSYGPSTFTSSMMMFGENRLGIFQSEKSGVFATHY